jgi:hypothetical protein
MLRFNIYNKNGEIITLRDLDKEICQMWNQPLLEGDFLSAPTGLHDSWYQILVYCINAHQYVGLVCWEAMIGVLASASAIEVKDLKEFDEVLEYYKPYIKVFIEFNKKGYQLVTTK